MKRSLFTILCALSLLLFLAVCVMWVRSYSVEESITGSGPRGLWDISVSRGDVHFWREWMPDRNLSYEEHETLNPFGLRHLSESPSERVDPFEGETLKGFDLQFWGMRIAQQDRSGTAWPNKVNYAKIPCWVVALLLIVLPASSAIVIHRRWRRQRALLCPSCGYDLRATPGRCPECGTSRASQTC